MFTSSKRWPVISTCDGVGLPQTIRTESRNHVIMMTIDRTSYSVSMIGVYKKVSTLADLFAFSRLPRARAPGIWTSLADSCADATSTYLTTPAAATAACSGPIASAASSDKCRSDCR